MKAVAALCVLAVAATSSVQAFDNVMINSLNVANQDPMGGVGDSVNYFETTFGVDQGMKDRELYFSFDMPAEEMFTSAEVMLEDAVIVTFTPATEGAYTDFNVEVIDAFKSVVSGELMAEVVDHFPSLDPTFWRFSGTVLMTDPTLDYEGMWKIAVIGANQDSGEPVEATSAPVTTYGWKMCTEWGPSVYNVDVEQCEIQFRFSCGGASGDDALMDQNTLYPTPYSASNVALVSENGVEESVGFDATEVSADGKSFNYVSQAITYSVTPDSPKGLGWTLDVWHGYNTAVDPADPNDDNIVDNRPLSGPFDEFNKPGCVDFTEYCADPANVPIPPLPAGVTLDANTACSILSGADTYEASEDQCRNEIVPKADGGLITMEFKCASSCRITKFASDPTDEEEEGVLSELTAKNLVCNEGAMAWSEEPSQTEIQGRWPVCDCSETGGGDGASSIGLSVSLVSVLLVALKAL